MCDCLAVERLGRCWDCNQAREQRKDKAVTLWEASGMPAEVWRRSFSRINRGIAHTPALAAAETWAYGPTGLYLWGPTGTGKTHLAQCMANRVIWELGLPVLFLELPKLFQDLRASFDSRDPEPRHLLRRARNVNFLVLDDIGVGHSRDFGEAELLPIIDHRNTRGLPTIYTSNCSFARADALREFGTLADKLGMRIADRVADKVRCIAVKGASRRSKGVQG